MPTLRIKFTDKITWVRLCRTQDEFDKAMDHLKESITSQGGTYTLTEKQEKKFALVKGGNGKR